MSEKKDFTYAIANDDGKLLNRSYQWILPKTKDDPNPYTFGIEEVYFILESSIKYKWQIKPKKIKKCLYIKEIKKLVSIGEWEYLIID